MTERVPYRVAGAATRLAHQRAREKSIGLEGHRALAAVLDHTTSYSKLSDHVPLGKLADAAGLHRRNLSRALRELADAGIIEYEPGRGRGHKSWIGVPATEDQKVADLHHLSRVADPELKGGRSHTEKVADCDQEKVALHARARSSEKKDHLEDQSEKNYLQAAPASESRHDELVEALFLACGYEDPLTKSAEGELHRAAKVLDEVGATFAEVVSRVVVYRERWPEIRVAPSALAKWWPTLSEENNVVDDPWAGDPWLEQLRESMKENGGGW